MLVDAIKANAKAIAVPITAIVLAFLKWVSTNAGVEIVVDNEAAVNVVATAIVAVVVWFTRNRAKPAPE